MLISLRVTQVQAFVLATQFYLVLLIHSVAGQESNSTVEGSTGGIPSGSGKKGPRLNVIILRGWNNPRSRANNWDLLKIVEDEVGQEVEDKIKALEKKHCDHVFVHCYDFWRSRYNRLKQIKLEDRCFRLVKGYVHCPNFTREDASKAKENVDKEDQELEAAGKAGGEDGLADF